MANRGNSGRLYWSACVLASALVCAALRKWQLESAFEEGTGLAVPGAQASVILTCVLVMAAAWFTILALYTPLPRRRWALVFLDTEDRLYPILMISAAFLALAAAPVLLKTGIGQWRLYQDAVSRGDLQPPSNNGVLTMAAAAGSLLSFLGLFQMGWDALRPGRRGKGGFSAALPGAAGCVWLMESFRAHASNPVRWDYAPLLLAIACGMQLYMDFAGMSAGSPRPRRLLWMSAMTIVLSAAALVSTRAEGAWGDALLLAGQCLAAAAVLWHLPPCLENRAKAKGDPISRPGRVSIQEETTDE